MRITWEFVPTGITMRPPGFNCLTSASGSSVSHSSRRYVRRLVEDWFVVRDGLVIGALEGATCCGSTDVNGIVRPAFLPAKLSIRHCRLCCGSSLLEIMVLVLVMNKATVKTTVHYKDRKERDI